MMAKSSHPAEVVDEFKALLDGELDFTDFSVSTDGTDGAERIIGLQAQPRQLDPEAVHAARADVQKEREALTESGKAVIEAIARYASCWWRTAVEDVVVADPERTLNAAAQLPDLKIALLQLQSQALELTELLIAPALPHTDEEIREFRSLLRGNQPSVVLEEPIRVLLGAVASPLAKAGLIDPGGNIDFVVNANVWRFRFGIDMTPLHECLAAYDAQVERLREHMAQLQELERELARGQAKALWEAA